MTADATPDPSPAAADDGLWVRSEVLSDGSYGIGLSAGPDRAWALTRAQAVDYAVACFAHATAAEHATAVVTLLTDTLGMPLQQAYAFVGSDLRPAEALHGVHDATAPLEFQSAVGRAKYPRPDAGAHLPTIRALLDGERLGELTPADLRRHASAVLAAITAADLDQALFTALTTGENGVDEPRVRALIEDLVNHWPAHDRPWRLE